MKLILKASPSHSKIVPGTVTFWDGRKWEAREQQTLGWTWEIVQGRGLGHDSRETVKFFQWDHPIYLQERFAPLQRKKVIKPLENKDQVVDIPEEFRSARGAYDHALEIGKPYPEGEHFISQSAKYSYFYAANVLRKRFMKGERAIMEDPYYSAMYAIRILKHRWPEVEDKILNDKLSGKLYRDHFIF